MSIKPGRRGVIAALFIGLATLLVAAAASTSPPPATVLEACVNKTNGNMRLVDATTVCHHNEKRVQWNVTGPTGPAGPAGATGPAGPAGPAGPGGSGGGPPYVWVCTPAHRPNAGGSPRDDVYVFNGSAGTANVAVNILDKNGNNLAGVNIPGSSPARTYPGESGATTVPLAAGNTRDVDWVMPTTSGPGFDGVTNVAITVRVTADKPIVVGANFEFNGDIPSQCSLLPK
ncbi:MAG TPA: hypothetical protein VJT50_15960 [Pyrinomonadaceae bacterium]|nr:hypothetical protein [Pyrinomonadaceae bacterium]